MFSGKKVRELLEGSNHSASDLAEYLYGDRTRTLVSILSDTANPTAKILEKVANFLHVSVEEFFIREDGFELQKSNEELTREVWEAQIKAKDIELASKNAEIEAYKKLIASQERELAYARERAQDGGKKKSSKKVSQ